MNYNNFNMIIDKDIIDSCYFYDRIINHWFCDSKRNYEKILIYSDELDLTVKSIMRVCPNIKCIFHEDYIEGVPMEITQEKYHNTFEIKIKEKFSKNEKRTLKIIIQFIDKIKLNQKGLMLSGVILDINNKNNIENYLDDNFIDTRILPYLLLPTDLDIGLTLYY